MLAPFEWCVVTSFYQSLQAMSSFMRFSICATYFTLSNESINAHKELKKRQAHEINFSDLTPKEENQLYACEDFFAEDKEEQTFFAGGKELSAKLIADAIHNLPEEKRRAVLLYYFFDMSDAEIAALYQIPRSTVQYRRTSSFELLKRYLEEHAYDYPDW